MKVFTNGSVLFKEDLLISADLGGWLFLSELYVKHPQHHAYLPI